MNRSGSGAQYGFVNEWLRACVEMPDDCKLQAEEYVSGLMLNVNDRQLVSCRLFLMCDGLDMTRSNATTYGMASSNQGSDGAVSDLDHNIVPCNAI